VFVERIEDNAIGDERTSVHVERESTGPASWSLLGQLGAGRPPASVCQSERYAIGDRSHAFP